jgi:hypothetical protein
LGISHLLSRISYSPKIDFCSGRMVSLPPCCSPWMATIPDSTLASACCGEDTRATTALHFLLVVADNGCYYVCRQGSHPRKSALQKMLYPLDRRNGIHPREGERPIPASTISPPGMPRPGLTWARVSPGNTMNPVRQVKPSYLPYTFLSPNGFMQNLVNSHMLSFPSLIARIAIEIRST